MLFEGQRKYSLSSSVDYAGISLAGISDTLNYSEQTGKTLS